MDDDKLFSRHTIDNIVPAAGWRAVFVMDDGTVLETPVLCWALVTGRWKCHHNDDQRVEGMVAGSQGDILYAIDSDSFTCYLGPGETLRKDTLS